MNVRRKIWITFVAIVLLASLAGLVDFPKGPNLRLGSFSRELKLRLGLDLQGGTRLVYDADTNAIASVDQGESLEGVRDVIERRVNAFGVSEPVVQTSRVGDQWRVSVELPGVKDINEAINLIGETPTLEFREQSQTTEKPDGSLDAEKKAQAVSATQRALGGEDFAALANELSQDPGNTDPASGEQKGGDLGWARRGTYVPEFETALFDTLKVGEVTKEPVKSQFGYHVIKKVDERTFEENGETVTEVRASHILFSVGSSTESYVPTKLSGKNLKRSVVQFDQTTGEPQVSLLFDEEGKSLFSEITSRNVGKPLAIYLDGAPISVPVVQQAITDGTAVITGTFDLKEAKTLAQRLNAGALPVPITLVNQQTVEPTLGRASIDASFFAALVGLAAVAFFMIIYYRLPGLLAVVALGVYGLVVLALFKLLGVTLTLAGVAGFILSIGMAVDANILIFERMKEELRAGRPLPDAVEEGFRRAWLSIRDSNASSILTSVILAWFGTSVVKGFAITLLIGIIVSMFSAITVTRTFLRLLAGTWVARRPKLFGVAVTPSP